MNNKAFTIIELLVASALSVLLMVGVLRVVGSLQLKTPQEDVTSSLASDALVKLLAWDMLNAQTIYQEDNTIILTGHGSLKRPMLDDKTDQPQAAAHQPVRVEYKLRETQSGSWLTRRQTHLNDMTNHNAWTEVVSYGVSGIELQPIEPQTIAQGIIENWLREPSPVPNSVWLVVEPTDDSEQTIDQLMVLR